MEQRLSEIVWQRANSRCEYCQLPQELSSIRFEIDHIIAQKHGGKSQEDNLALSCFFCNSHKGPNIAGIDPETGKLVRLFHPRKDKWDHHFEWNGVVLIGQTSIARATISVLNINHSDFVTARQAFADEGVFPIMQKGRR